MKDPVHLKRDMLEEHLLRSEMGMFNLPFFFSTNSDQNCIDHLSNFYDISVWNSERGVTEKENTDCCCFIDIKQVKNQK